MSLIKKLGFTLKVYLALAVMLGMASFANSAYQYEDYDYYDEIEYDSEKEDIYYNDDEMLSLSEKYQGAETWDDYYAEAHHIYSDMPKGFKKRLRNFFDFIHSYRLVIEDIGKDWHSHEWDYEENDDHHEDNDDNFNGSISIQLTKALGGTSNNEDLSSYVIPSSANDKSGFRGRFNDYYPLNFEDGGQIHFTATSEQPAHITFSLKSKFKRHKHIKTDSILVSGECATYSIDISSNKPSVYKSLYMFITERDIPVSIGEIVIGNDIPSCDQESNDLDDGDTDGSDTDSSDTDDSNTDGSDTDSSDTGGSDIGGSDTDDSETDGTDTDGSDTDGSDDTSNETTKPVQRITVSNQPTGLLGDTAQIEVTYDASTNNNQLSGLGLRIHFDSSVLTFNAVSNVLEQDIIVNGEGPINDVDDFDNDPQTDSFISFGWASLFNNWPNTELPSVLMNITFGVSASVDLNSVNSTQINFSDITTSTGYEFETVNLNLELTETESTWDFDGNGDADALTDGLIMMRYSFGLRGDSMADNVMAANSVMSAPQVEERIQKSMQIADIDNDGNVDALTDGLILLRHLFAIEDENLTHGAIGISATRKTRTAIKQHLNKHMPKKKQKD
ncbi:MAG: Uncharacterised protein [Cellvibrionales bacterium UBA7375]|nr:MAG: Uncharacterised protein [Cellvibrionales bacterium UBA7375]